ncbi:MAG: hypothetical protein IJW88_10445 [Alistipes sp.]|nr:hypothetical protein [Alistipes sp.]
MRKILFTLVAILGFASCVQEELPVQGNTPSNSEYIDLHFSVMVPEMQSVSTRTMATPDITKLHLFVFDESGYILQVLEAKLGTETNDNTYQDTKATQYTVEKIVSSGYKRILHLVANLPDVDTDGYYSENDFFSKLTVEGDNDVYWQRVVLEDGINTNTNMGVVPLVRNYTKITVAEALDNFALTGMMLINIPTKGSVAPYHTTSNGVDASRINGNFAKYDADTDYSTLLAQSYYGYEPLDCALTNQAIPSDAAGWKKEHYIFERYQKETLNRTYAIIRGKYSGDTADTYYKVDIINKNGDVFNLLRNISYNISITNVTGSGFSSAEAAINSGAASNNLSFAVETRNLLNISDGSSRLFIEYFQKVLTVPSTDDKTETFTFRYRYVPDIKSPKVSQNTSSADGNVVISWSNFAAGVVNGAAVIADGDTSTDGVNWVSNTQLAADSDGYVWNEVTFNVAKRPADANGNLVRTMVQNFTISAKNSTTGATLSRVVEVRLVDPFVLDLYVAPQVGSAVGATVPTTLTLPKDLPEGIFPLKFNLVAGNNSLTSTLPVASGLDINGVPTTNGKYFGYVVTVEYSDYDPNTGVAIYPPFKTNMANAAEAFDSRTDKSEGYHDNINNNGTKLRVYNPYFEQAFSQFWLGTIYGLQITLNDATATNVITELPFGIGHQFVAKVTIGNGVPSTMGDLRFKILHGNGVKIVGIYGEDGTPANNQPGAIDGDELVVTPTEYSSTKTYSILFETVAVKSASTIEARNEYFNQALASFTNTTVGNLAIRVSDATIYAGPLVEEVVTVILPPAIESLFVDDKLTVSLNLGDDFLELADYDANVTKSGGSIYKVTFHKADYDNEFNGATYDIDFVSTKANTPAERSIEVSHDYLTSASTPITTSSYGGLAMNLTAGASLVPGAGQSVAFTISVPAGLGTGVLNADGKLELSINTGSAYLKYASCTGGTISGEGSAFTVVLDNYDSSKVNTITCNFTTTNGNNVGTRTITVSHPYMDSASAQTKTAKLSFTAININGSTSQQTIHGSGQDVKVNVTLPNDMPEALFANGGLVLTLTATEDTLNADTDTGTSGSGKTFTKTVTYAEYTPNKVVTFDFTTNSKNVGTSWGILGTYAKTTEVTVSNPNFEDSTSISFKTNNSN